MSENYFTNSKNGKIYTSLPDSVYKKDNLTTLTGTTKYFYDNYGNQTKQRTISGNSIVTRDIIYDQYGTWAWGNNKPHKITTTQSYTGQPNIVRSEYFFYDNKGNITQHTKDSTDVNKIRTSYSNYNQYGNPGKITTIATGISRSQTLTYTPSGRFIKTKKNDQLNETVTYNYGDESKGLLTSKVDRLGATSYDYDGFGRLKLTTYPDGIKTATGLRWAGTTFGKPTNAKYYSYIETSGQSPVWVWYDNLGREIRRDSYGLNSKKIMVDTEYYTNTSATGLVHYVSDPYFENTPKTWTTTYNYDGFDRVSSVETPMGTTKYFYSVSTLTDSISSPSGTKTTKRNSAGWVVEEKTNGKKVTFTHRADGLVKEATPQSATPQDEHPIEMEYDLRGNRTKLKDPDAGVITSEYDGWGRLVREAQKIHKTNDSIITTYSYHSSGLLQSKTRQVRNAGSGETTKYGYDNLHRLNWVSISGKHAQGFVYDQYDRIIQSNDTVDGSKVFVRKTEYDLLGNVSKETYPSGYGVTNRYDKYGYLTEITDKNNSNVWKAVESNAKGQLTKSSQGGHTTTFGFDSRGFPDSISNPGIIRMKYYFNTNGNLDYRQDNLTGYKESFNYDPMNRLTNWVIYKNNVQQGSNSFTYNAATGLIDYKGDWDGYSSMSYGENGKPPHALTSVTRMAGTIPEETNQDITYTDFKKVKQITEGSNVLNISYGADEQRIKTVLTKPGGTLTRYYMGNYEEEIRNGNTRKIHYLNGGNGLAAVYVQNAGKDTLYYAHTDYQGSLLALSLTNGTVAEQYAYDPWGNRRSLTDWRLRDTRTAFILTRGYTLHEHLTEFNLINMNGRVYDPLRAQFLSPDPYIQAPGNWLNYNRYTYAYNNPLIYTDPDGEIIFTLLAGIFCPALAPAAAQLDMAWMQGGFMAKMNGGNFWSGAGKGFITGAMNAGLSFLNVPGMIPNGLLHAGGNVLSNGITNAMYGQDFFSGWGFHAATGFAGGAYSGYQLSKKGGLNYWWGNEVKYNRTQWSFYNVDKPDYVIDFGIPNVGSKTENDCVPTSFYEAEVKHRGGRTYDDFKSSTGYREGEGVRGNKRQYERLINRNFPNNVQTLDEGNYSDVFSPSYMQNAVNKGKVVNVNFIDGTRGHSDNVRELQVFLRDPSKNRLIFRQSSYNFNSMNMNNAHVANIFFLF